MPGRAACTRLMSVYTHVNVEPCKYVHQHVKHIDRREGINQMDYSTQFRTSCRKSFCRKAAGILKFYIGHIFQMPSAELISWLTWTRMHLTRCHVCLYIKPRQKKMYNNTWLKFKTAVKTHLVEPGCHQTTESERCPFCCRVSSPSGHHHRLLKVGERARGRESEREQGGAKDEGRTDRAGEMEPT